jgi:mono/diheme cytochrome c family protein
MKFENQKSHLVLCLAALCLAAWPVDNAAFAESPAEPEDTTTTATARQKNLPPLEGEDLEWAEGAWEEKCALCHDSDGSAAESGNIRSNLVDQTWNHGNSPGDIEKTIREGIPDTMMKAQGKRLSPEEITLLARYVIRLGHEKHMEMEESKREEASELTDQVAEQLVPEKKVPIADRKNFIDEHIFGKMEKAGVFYAGKCSDAVFYRRIHLDLWGRLPDAEGVRAFLADGDHAKRDKLIDKLLGLDVRVTPGNEIFQGPWLVDKPFLTKWTFFFEDLFRNASQRNYNVFREYIYRFLMYNLPYDYIVREMLTATAIHGTLSGPAGYLIQHAVDGLRGEDNMHEDTCDEIALHTVQNFLGINMQCISCHDGGGHLEGVNLWLSRKKRSDFWNQAAFFGNLRMFRPEATGGNFALLDGAAIRPEDPWVGKIMYHEFTTPVNEWGATGYRMEAPSVLRPKRITNVDVEPEYLLTGEKPETGENPREEFARMLTSDFQFAKATVNLFWAQFMTVGIVDPPLDWDMARQDPDNPPPAPWTIQPSHPKLLNELARDFIDHKYDLRHLFRRICRSNAYQLSSRFEGEYKPEHDRYYARKLVRRLSAEEIYDGLAKATGVFGHGTEYAMELKEPPGDIELREFLDFFGRNNRFLTKMGNRKPSVIQASLMMNGSLVKKKIQANTEGSLTQKLLKENPPWEWSKPDKAQMLDKVIEEVYLATLSRLPTAEERATSKKHVARHRDLGLENLQWALFNKLEFIVNY